MELCYLKETALDTLKNALPQIFGKYFTERDNAWLAEVCGENPFRKFRDVDDFELAPIDDGFEPGKIDFDNSKILYEHLSFLTPRQAADEKFWAGLCHGAFYDYVRRRHKYDTAEICPKAVGDIKTRFFFEAISRTGIFRNTLSKCWWTGRAFFDATRNNFEKLDIVGSNDISSKISYVLRYPFAANPKILDGVVKFFKHFRDQNRKLGDLKKSLRPAMYELNKRGGAVVLDCLTDEEIAAIMIERVEKIFTARIVLGTPATKSVGTRTVEMNSLVTVTPLDGGKQKLYRFNNRFKKLFPDIFAEFVGKSINSTVTLKDGKFTITDIK